MQTRFDAKTMVDNPKVSASTGMVDDGTGVKEVFRVEMFDLVEVPEEQHGVFFAGDCYVILYAYSDGKKDCYIIYYWLGSNSSQDEQGAAALRTIELDQRLGGTPVQVRVVQGKEPTHFTAMFGGKMTVFQVRIALNIFSPALSSLPGWARLLLRWGGGPGCRHPSILSSTGGKSMKMII